VSPVAIGDYVESLTGRYQDIDLDDVHDAAGNVVE
jgi:hypothetical protein